jgi:hypothetical protein
MLMNQVLGGDPTQQSTYVTKVFTFTDDEWFKTVENGSVCALLFTYIHNIWSWFISVGRDTYQSNSEASSSIGF